jgi:hypothetical protein
MVHTYANAVLAGIETALTWGLCLLIASREQTQYAL